MPPGLQRMPVDHVGDLKTTHSLPDSNNMQYSKPARAAMTEALMKKLRMIFFL
jgi:hypothetical protein